MSTSDKGYLFGMSWEEFWGSGVDVGECFDRGNPLPELVAQLSAGALPRGARALVPGCGRGYDIEALVQSGLYETVVGLDISKTAVAAANEYLAGRKMHGEYGVIVGDFFNEEDAQSGFCLVYDCSFFCAIDLDMRRDWAKRVKELIHVGGVLVTVMYPMDKPREEGGPPHGVSETDYAELLEGEGGFMRKDGPRALSDEMTHEGLESRTWWAVWERV